MRIWFVPTREQVLEFIAKYNDPRYNAIVTQVPITNENMELIDAIPEVLNIAIHRRWRGKGWCWGYHTKKNAERCSVYAMNRNINFTVYNFGDSVEVKMTKKIFGHCNKDYTFWGK